MAGLDMNTPAARLTTCWTQLTTVRRAARVSEQHLWEYDDAGDRDEVCIDVRLCCLLVAPAAA